MSFVERLREKEKERENNVEANDNLELQDEAVYTGYFGTENQRNLSACLDFRLAEGKR